MLTKIVNGVEIAVPIDEEMTLLADWVANDPAKQPPMVKTLTVDKLSDVLITKGFIVKGDLL